jgi:hypothetical protein
MANEEGRKARGGGRTRRIVDRGVAWSVAWSKRSVRRMAKRGRSRGGEVSQPAPVSLDPVVRAIESLRRLRVRGEPARTMGESFVKERDQLARSRASLGSVLEAWERVVPPELRERCWPSALSRRVLTVVVADAGTGYEFSMWLRGGGEGQLRTAAKTAVSRVKVEVTSEGDPAL